MKRWATSLRAALYLACVLPMGAWAQAADPAVWGVYARLLGAKLAWDQTAALTFSWYWNGDKTAIVEDQGNGQLDTGEIKSLGNGRLARFVKGELLWSGTIQSDGAVIWVPEGGFFTRRAGGPFRIRLRGDSALVEEGVVLQNGKVTQASLWRRMVGSLPAPVPAEPAPAVVAAASAPDAAASAPLAVAEALRAEERAGPRMLTEADLAKLRGSMARDKLQRAETLKRQAVEARRQEEARRQQAEYEARMAEQRAQQEREEREEERQSDDAFASALMGGLNTFKNEMAKNQAERARQQAFVANLQRQQQQANEVRQREQDRQRQAAAHEQLVRQQQAAAAQQQRQLAAARPAQAQPSPAAAATQAVQSPQARAQAEATDRERQLRENAAADRLRRQQIQDYRLAQERATQPAQLAQNAAPQATSPSPASPTPAMSSGTAPSSSSCRVDRVTTMAVGRNKTEASTRADVEAMAAKQCQGKGQLGPIQCSSSRDISIDSHGRQHDLGTRTYDCSAVVDCGRTNEVCYGPPQSGSAQ